MRTEIESRGGEKKLIRVSINALLGGTNQRNKRKNRYCSAVKNDKVFPLLWGRRHVTSHHAHVQFTKHFLRPRMLRFSNCFKYYFFPWSDAKSFVTKLMNDPRLCRLFMKRTLTLIGKLFSSHQKKVIVA